MGRADGAKTLPPPSPLSLEYIEDGVKQYQQLVQAHPTCGRSFGHQFDGVHPVKGVTRILRSKDFFAP